MNIRFAPNTLYYGDCLDIMADFPDNSIDLIWGIPGRGKPAMFIYFKLRTLA